MAIGDFPATDAERLCFGTVRGADPVQHSPFAGEQSGARSALPHLRAPRIPGAVSASSCAEQTFCY